MANFSLSLFGAFRVLLDDKPVSGFGSDKVRALLAYLAVEADSLHRREVLCGLLWPDVSETNARQSLSTALYNLRRVLGDRSVAPPFLLVTRHTIQFNLISDHRVDAGTFVNLLGDCEQHSRWQQGCVQCVARLQQAVALYRRPFLEGFSLADSPPFEEWIRLRREHLHRLAVDALQWLAVAHEERSEYEQALLYARRRVELDPWHEEAHQQVMRLLARSGRRGEALVQYETCRSFLAQELAAAPSASSVKLRDQIRNGELDPPQLPLQPPLDPLGPHLSFLADEEVWKDERPVCVAREQELAQLESFLEAAMAGQGRVVFITGEAGQGKTALIQAFTHLAQGTHADLSVATGSCNAYMGLGDPYQAFREILALLTGDVESAMAAGALSKEQAMRLWRLLPVSAQALIEDGPDLIDTFVPSASFIARAATIADGQAWYAQLRNLSRRRSGAPAMVDSQQLQLFTQYTRVLERLAQEQPLLLLLEDLHWADAGSLSLLFHLGRRLQGHRILVVGTYRPIEVTLGRGGERHPLELVLSELKRTYGENEVNLGRDADRLFIDAWLDLSPNRLGSTFRERLHAQTRGHPLFTVELMHGMQERGDVVRDEAGHWIEGSHLDWDALPARVEAVIGEGIGRLAEPLRRLLLVASVEGEIFTAEVLAEILETNEKEIVQSLSDELGRQHRLVQALAIQYVGHRRLTRYRFRHILFQRYLYSSLDVVEHKTFHEAVGSALETLYKGQEVTASIAAQLARHFLEAGNGEKALVYLDLAGKRALAMAAYDEAIAYLTSALELLPTQPNTPKLRQWELSVQLSLAVALAARRGAASSEAEQHYSRARDLALQLENPRQLYAALHGLARLYNLRTEQRRTVALGPQLLALAQELADPSLLSEAHSTLGIAYFWCGEHVLAREHLERAYHLYGAYEQHRQTVLYGHDAGVRILSYWAWVLWYLGYPDQALCKCQDAMALAEQFSDPQTQIFALHFAAVNHRQRGEPRAAERLAGRARALAETYGLAFWRAVTTTVYSGRGTSPDARQPGRPGANGHRISPRS